MNITSESSNKELRENIAQLDQLLADKETQIKELEAKISELETSPKAGLVPADRQRMINELNASNKKLQQKISDLEDELAAAKPPAGGSRSRKEQEGLSQLYDKAKDQIDKLTELLLKKEFDIESTRKEAMEAKEKLVNLQNKLALMENELSANNIAKDTIKNIERENFSLQSRLNELQEVLNRKEELTDSLQKNLEYLSVQLARREDELKKIESRFSTVDTTTKGEIDRQRTRYEEINTLYNSLKMQVSNLSDTLNQREAELDKRRAETDSLKEEIVRLQIRSEDLENDLVDARDRQRKTLDDLVAAVKLNTNLKESAQGAYSGRESSKAVSEQQKKADALKRKIEVILEPEK
jgi:chromosome segregation ATPase